MLGGPARGTPEDFVGVLGEAFRKASGDGARFSAGASDLEREHFDAVEAEDEGRGGRLETIESEPVIPRHPGEPGAHSKLSYFLDGAQQTQEIGRVGTIPVVVTTVAAAIVHRCERRLHRLDVEGAPTLLRALILPDTDDEGARTLLAAARASGLTQADSDSEAVASGGGALLVDSTQHGPAVDPADYPGLKARAYRRANALREALEHDLLARWERMETGEDWIAVDGQLPSPARNAVGLVKDTRRSFFGGEEARMLLDLQRGMRTTAFVPPWRAKRREEGHPEDERASWYVRLHPADASPERTDATSGLVRLETVVPSASTTASTASFDEISRWLLAEKAPLARPDPRWPSMIYPIRHVENILKPLVQGGRRARLRLEREIAALQRG